MNRKLYLGIDGGGSKTTAVVFDGEGSFAAQAVGESINYYSIGLEAARSNMAAIIGELCSALGENRFTAAVIGMSALGDRATEEELNAFASGIIDADKIIMDSDLFIGLEAMPETEECAMIISGTGSMAAARLKNGEIIHAGGWGHILGDEGSGYCIGLAGIKAAIAAFEGYGESTALLEDCLSYFGLSDMYGLIDLYYEKGVSRKTTAAFARFVRIRADEGDPVALRLIKTAVSELAATALSMIKKLSPASPIGLWGGMFQNSPLMRDEFCGLLSAAGYENAALLRFPPQLGAVFAAMKLDGTVPSDEISSRMEKTYKER